MEAGKYSPPTIIYPNLTLNHGSVLASMLVSIASGVLYSSPKVACLPRGTTCYEPCLEREARDNRLRALSDLEFRDQG